MPPMILRPMTNPARTLRYAATALVVSTLSLSPSAWARTQASAEPRPAITVSGTVRNSAGTPIADADVFFEEKATSASAQSKTKSDGTFSFLALRPGTYTLRAEKSGTRAASPASLLLSPGDKKQVDLILDGAQTPPSSLSGVPKSSSAAPPMEFDDQSSFTIAGVTDWTNVGGHGSDTKLRASESLAKETAALKPTETAVASASASEAARNADAHRLAGDRAEAAGDPLAAVHEYEQAVRLNPSEPNYFAWGAELLLHRAIKPAAEVFTKGSAAHPKSARMLAGLGAALYAGGSYANAARNLCTASDLQPADPSPYIFLGKMEKAAPDSLPCATEKLARFAHDQPTNPLGNYYYAVALWKQSRDSTDSPGLQQAEAVLQKALAADPNFAEAYLQLGAVYTTKGNLPQAIAAYEKAAKINPRSGEAHFRLAQAYKRSGENEKSEQEVQLYKQADKAENAAVERQRREIRQFLIILKDEKPQ
jgi:tetratricopeptide (TPR) repeat protein